MLCLRRSSLVSILLSGLLLAACAQLESQTFQATVAPTRIGAGAPVYTPTPTLTYTPTPTYTITPSPTLTLTLTPTPTRTPTPTLTFTPSPTLTPTVALQTLTPPARAGAPQAALPPTAALAATAGWSCGDFPCEDDIAGFKARIQIPAGYRLDHFGQFPGQPMQITYGPDGRLYATVLEDGATHSGAVYAMDEAGRAERYAGDFVSPVGLAFQPGADVLYVSSRLTAFAGGVLWRVPPGEEPEIVLDDLPCCFSQIDNQPNGMVFGPDGYLYLGIGALTDHAEPPNPQEAQYAKIHPLEAAILRIQPHTGAVETWARGLHNPYDVTFDAEGQFFATDQGLVSGQGDRLLAIKAGAHYGWPYWRTRACDSCPARPGDLDVEPDLVTFPPYSIPRGLVAYTGAQFPQNFFNSLFVVLWNGTEMAQRVIWFPAIDLAGENEPVGEPFVTGLIRPIDVTIAPDGSLVVADFIYGHVWRISYAG